MSGSPKRTTYTINIADKFKASGDHELKMMAQVARICVLYEDFMFEVNQLVGELGGQSSGYANIQRNFYFARRATATTWEMKQAVDVLGLNPVFKARKAKLERQLVKVW